MKNFIPHFIQDQEQAGQTNGYLKGFTMFIDLSGFTALTESLMARGNEGAERLSLVLNNIFSPMVELVYRYGGIIPYFAGDAFTAIFQDTDRTKFSPTDFVYTARRIINLFSEKGFTFDEFEIGIKMGLSYGVVEWGIVGAQPKTFYFRGQAIDACAESEMRANQQEIILDKSLYAQLPPSFPVTPTAHPDYMLLSGEIAASDKGAGPLIERQLDMDPEVLQRYVPDAILNSASDGEFRSVISIFISFQGVNNHASLNDFVTVVLQQFDNFSGYFKEVDFGDKGGVLVGFFGAPVSFENNRERAMECVLAIDEGLREVATQTGLQYRVGITAGIAYTGIIGGEARCQYAAVGNRVNIAARLMTHANWGEILVDQELHDQEQYRFKHKGDLHYKGVAADVPTYKYLGRREFHQQRFAGKLVGRKKELDQLEIWVNEAFEQRAPRFVYVYGDVGIGKSRLTNALRIRLKKGQKIQWVRCAADQMLRKPFNPMLTFLRRYFGQSPEQKTAENLKAFERRFQELLEDTHRNEQIDTVLINRELLRTKPILAALVGLDASDTIWARLDARGRYENAQAAIINLLITLAMIRPLVIELEDGQWYDENSKELLRRMVQQTTGLPIVWLCTSRLLDEGTSPRLVTEETLNQVDIQENSIHLEGLADAAIARFVDQRLEGKLHPDFLKLLRRTTNGNPFYLEQVLEYFRESELLVKEGDAWSVKDDNIQLSTSINAILTARIDRLSNLVKETVKAAAVIGREFEVPVLREVLHRQELLAGNEDAEEVMLREQIDEAERGQIWQALNELRYAFRNTLLREVVYDMQLRARLRELHLLIAEAIESLYPEQLDQRGVDLAYHYEQAESFEKMRFYLERAVEYARQNYQNRLALRCYDKLIAYYEQAKEWEAAILCYIGRGEVQERIGQWEDAGESWQHGVRLANKHKHWNYLGRLNGRLGNLRMLQGDYPDAQTFLKVAMSYVEEHATTEDAAQIYGNLGTLYFRQGDYPTAIEWFTKSIRLNEGAGTALNNAPITANLGLAFMNLGQYSEGVKWMQAQLTLSRDADDRPSMATLYVNLGIVHYEKGDYDEALFCYEKGLQLAEELGNKQLTAIAIGSIGRLHERRGLYDKAMELYERDLKLVRELGDKQGIAIAYGLLGELEAILGHNEHAVRYLQKNLELSRELNYQKGMAKAINALGDIYYWEREYNRSADYYEESVGLARQINNQPVLCESLIELGHVRLRQGELDTVSNLLEEALALARQLEHRDLLFRARFLRVRWLWAEGKREEAVNRLNELIGEDWPVNKQASLYYERYRYLDNGSDRKMAYELYKGLYERTPRFSYRRRLDQLQQD